MKETIELIADLACRESPPVVCAKEGDADSREVRVRFLFGDKPFDVSEAESAELRVLKPDGNLSIIDGTLDTEDNSASFTLTDQALNVGGEGRMEFVLYGGNDEVISTVPARLNIVPRAVGDPAAVSTNEYLEFKRLIEQFTSQFVVMSEEEYRGITPAANTVYFVYGENGAAVYYGNVSVGTARVCGNSVIALHGAVGRAGNAQSGEV